MGWIVIILGVFILSSVEVKNGPKNAGEAAIVCFYLACSFGIIILGILITCGVIKASI
jgi:hypothetical protein